MTHLESIHIAAQGANNEFGALMLFAIFAPAFLGLVATLLTWKE